MDLKNYALKALAIVLMAFIGGCDMIEYHPYDLNINGETGINGKNIELIEKKTEGKDELKIVVISDTQRWYDETRKGVNYINQLKDVDFVVHAGDLSDFGLKKEFELQRDILNKLNVPYIVTLGNHDCLGTGIYVFEEMFGPYNYSFRAGSTLFICVNTNALEFDHTVGVPDFDFLRKELDNVTPDIKKTVVIMHAGPFSDQFNKEVDIFHEYIKHFPNLQFCIYGHGHHVSVDDFFKDGIYYYECACAEKRQLLQFKIKVDGYDYEVLDF